MSANRGTISNVFTIRTICVYHPHDMCGASAPLVRSINTTIEKGKQDLLW